MCREMYFTFFKKSVIKKYLYYIETLKSNVMTLMLVGLKAKKFIPKKILIDKFLSARCRT